MESMLQFVGLLLKVGERYSLDVTDLGKLCQKIMVLSFKYVPRKAVWAELFGEDYVDWDIVDVDTKSNVLGDCSAWMSLLSYCDWSGLSKLETTMQMVCPPLHQLRVNLKECGLDLGGPEAWTMAAKVMVLYLVRGLVSAYSIERLTCGVFKRDTRGACLQFMANQAESLFTPEELSSALVTMLRSCKVETEALEQTLSLARAQMEEHRKTIQKSRMNALQGRPSLRDHVRNIYRAEDKKVQMDTNLQTWDSYSMFCTKHQFAPTLSEKVKNKLYFMASQTRWPWRDHLEFIVKSSAQLLAKVAEHPVTVPDVDILVRVINGMSMEGAPPFEQMIEFKRNCFDSFPMRDRQRMHLSMILRLYVAAYQAEAIWKECWKLILGVISPQIISDVERFVRENPFCEKDFMRLFLLS